jgi:hypothetical protein
VLRRRADGNSATDDATAQWQGLVKEIKNDNMKRSETVRQEMAKMRARIERIEKGVEGNSKILQAIFEKIEK